MKLHDLINTLITTFDYKSFCEIGYARGDTHQKINCLDKIGIDPVPLSIVTGHVVDVCSSDQFFEKINRKYDIYLIDGDHCETAVEKDIKNCLMHLNNGGCIVLHDICPYYKSLVTPQGSGDGFKAFMHQRTINSNVKMYVVDYFDCDEYNFPPYSDSTGWGIIFKGAQDLWIHPIEYTWEYMNQHKKELMNITPLDTIIKEQQNAKK